jgi:hypothetical protein
VTTTSDPASYQLTDRLGRAAGEIQRFSPLGYYVRPEPGSALDGMPRGMFATLNDATAAIAYAAKGVCQIVSGEQRQDFAACAQEAGGDDEGTEGLQGSAAGASVD